MRARIGLLRWIALDICIILAVYNFCYYVCRVQVSLGVADYIESIMHPTYYQAMLMIVPIYIIALYFSRSYRILWRYAQPSEYFVSVLAIVAAGGIYFCVCRTFFPGALPFYFYALVTALFSLCFLASRMGMRMIVELFQRFRQKDKTNKRRTLIIGCGNACTTLLTEIRNTTACAIDPVVAVDSDTSKIGRSICGVPIAGSNEDVERLCKQHEIELIIIAIPSANNRRRAELIETCAPTGCEVKILPRVHDFEKQDGGYVQKLRAITPDELLGREPISIEDEQVRAFTVGKTVLITGGGGSIGSELCRQIAANHPKKLVIVDVYENNAYDIQQELIIQYGDRLDLDVQIASVRDYGRICAILQEESPDLIIHAAAHKHVPLMEDSPDEAIKNNVMGTLNLARAAIACKTPRFILISTDKAVNPTNVMGASKRLCEMIIQTMNDVGVTSFSAVRFGNVLGSNGSVIPLFMRQIEAGGPVTVTHPDIIRYFMTIPEAVQLVLTAGVLAKGGEIFVLDMGRPVKILSLAQNLISLSGRTVGKDIEIKFTGLRPGEKLYEELLMGEEGLETTENDKIYVGKAMDIDRTALFADIETLMQIATDTSLSREEMKTAVEQKLLEIVPTFHRA